MNALPYVEFFTNTDQYLYYASRLHAGLCALAGRGQIRLRYRVTRGGVGQEFVSDSVAVCLRVEGPGGADRRVIAIDLLDRGDAFCEMALEHCDVYYKRNYHEPALGRLPAVLARKVRPYGFNYYCRNRESVARVLRTLAPRLALRGPDGFRTLLSYLSLPDASAFEQSPEASVRPTVVYQTRVWDPHETTGEGDDTINEERVALVRALKDAFGERFQGGLVPTPTAISRYPEEVSRLPTRRGLYTAWSKGNLIGVYTRGVHRSTAAKLPEYLAASQCVVAEPLRNGLPVPLIERRHFLGFRTPEECVAACRRLFEDNALAGAMRRANHEYYLAEVEPAAHAMRVLLDSMPESQRSESETEALGGSPARRSGSPA